MENHIEKMIRDLKMHDELSAYTGAMYDSTLIIKINDNDNDNDNKYTIDLYYHEEEEQSFDEYYGTIDYKLGEKITGILFSRYLPFGIDIKDVAKVFFK